MAPAADRDRCTVPAWVEPMLAVSDGGRLPRGGEWAYEYKLDGYRAALRVAQDGTAKLTSRIGRDLTDEFPELIAALRHVPGARAAVFDGEIIAEDERGTADFALLQNRRSRRPAAVRYIAFDLLQLGDQVLLEETYDVRREWLEQIGLSRDAPVALMPTVTSTQLSEEQRDPADVLDRVAQEGGEGLVAKRRTSRYVPGRRSGAWRKHPLMRTQDGIVCGWLPGRGRLGDVFGALLLGAHDPDSGAMVYLGDVGSGFTELARKQLHARLAELSRSSSPIDAAVPRKDSRPVHWVEPRLVGEVRYRQVTPAGQLRHTAWRGLRADRDPADVTAPVPKQSGSSGGGEVNVPQDNVTVQVGARRLALSRLDKQLYPSGYTKAQVLDYYRRVAGVMLPHLSGRPVTLVRFPDGTSEQRFFEKNVPSGAPTWLHTARLPSISARGDGEAVEAVVIDELATLIWVANLAALELHVPQWRLRDDPDAPRGAPDRLLFDLDPGPGVTLIDCARLAEHLRDALIADGLTPLVKTSGSHGLHVYAGIRTRSPQAPSRYAKSLAEHFAAEAPDQVTATMAKAQRAGRIFIDWSQNHPAKTTVAPYSLRGRDSPHVSTPLTWDEVRACERPEQLEFTADDVLDRVEELGDPFAELDATRAPVPRTPAKTTRRGGHG